MSGGAIIVPLTLREANDFVEKHHRHSARTSNDGGKFAIGLELDGELVGVAIFGRPVARLLQQDRLCGEALRVCTSAAAPRGSGSKLYTRVKRIWQLMGGRRVVTYGLESESGASLRGAGFEIEARVPARAWDTASRRRKPREIENEDKLRWGARMEELPL